ncbi:MAG: hypothetical protein IJS97_01485 [Prevotella sp.]|nr:hypothetical protein [Prevotella sp.]
MVLILFESSFWVIPDEWNMTEMTNLNFCLLTLMELLTLGMIPLALRMMKFKAVKSHIRTRREQGLLQVGLLRSYMLCLPMILNLLFYYLFMYAAYVYMAIILFLCVFFIFPTTSRCKRELEDAEQ